MSNREVLILIQARTGSKRFPGKVLHPLAGEPMLSFLLKRLQRFRHSCLLATSREPRDKVLVELGEQHGIPVFTGSEENVLERFYEAWLSCPAPVIVRITGDCPLIDPYLLADMLYFFQYAKADYLSNTLLRTFPKGLDTEIFTASALQKAFHQASSSYEKEHVTPYIYRHPELFRLYNFRDKHDLSAVNLSIDTPEDLPLVQEICKYYHEENPLFGYRDFKSFLIKKFYVTGKRPEEPVCPSFISEIWNPQ